MTPVIVREAATIQYSPRAVLKAAASCIEQPAGTITWLENRTHSEVFPWVRLKRLTEWEGQPFDGVLCSLRADQATQSGKFACLIQFSQE